MYDLSKEMNDFYENHVKVEKSVYEDLRDKKRKNLSRLKSGMEEYNRVNKTSYRISDHREQGSIAMATIVQNDEKDYDIDVAVIFDEENIGKDASALFAKRLVFAALRGKMGAFKEYPEIKTNCVRITYSEGYHIDFAVYKKCENDYWHAGAEWNERNPKAINDWFKDQVYKKGGNLRKVIRLSKMFCKSRPDWDMPAGLIQTVLCNECFVDSERLDECFYETMRNIVNRLNYNMDVRNPTDISKTLLTRKKDSNRLENYRKQLVKNLQNVTEAKDKKETLAAWKEFFNNDFWAKDVICESKTAHSVCFSKTSRAPGEEFIENSYETKLIYKAEIDTIAQAKGFREHPLSYFLNGNWLPHNLKLIFTAMTNTPKPYIIKWKVRNVGEIAESRNMIRGQIIDCDKGTSNRRTEHTDFYGPHYVECYVIKDNKCVAQARVNVPIS